MQIRLREVPLKIWEFGPPRRRLATTQITFHQTFKLFWKFPLQQTASKQQQRTLKGVFMNHSSRTEISRQQPFFCVRILFFISRCHEKELIMIAEFKLPTWNARAGNWSIGWRIYTRLGNQELSLKIRVKSKELPLLNNRKPRMKLIVRTRQLAKKPSAHS